MEITVKAILRIVLFLCVIVVFISDYSELLTQIFGTRTDNSDSRRPKPTNPGYGDIKTEIDLDAEIEDEKLQSVASNSLKNQMLMTIKNACLPKLICELNATPQKEKLTDSEKSLLTLIRESSLSTTAELTKYHFAAHMGQLISGIEGNGCHNFYPSCPFPGIKVLQMMKKVRMR